MSRLTKAPGGRFTLAWRRPAEEEPGCVTRAVRLPPDLAGFVSGQLTVKFAVGPAGDVREVVPLSSVPDPRLDGPSSSRCVRAAGGQVPTSGGRRSRSG